MSRLPSPSCETADPVDVHVGRRIRIIRKSQGISQSQLGEVLGITFQQVQKYENGTNRVSSSKLYRAAQALKTSVMTFYEGLPDPGADGNAVRGGSAHAQVLGGEMQRVAEAIPELAMLAGYPIAIKGVRGTVKAMLQVVAPNRLAERAD